MKRFTITLLAVAFAMGMSFNAFAASHMDHAGHGKEMSEEKMHHGDMEHADQGKHMGHEKKMEHAKEMSHDMHKGHGKSGGGLTEIGKDTQNGVVATVKVKTYDAETRETMKKMEMDATHHVMVFFAEEQGGKELTDGKVALKVKGDDAKPTMLMKMGTGFGADVSLGEGMHTLEVGTKLADGKKRQFSIMFHNM